MSEIRTIAADELWMSPQYRRDTVGIHFTWVRDQRAVERALVEVEAALVAVRGAPALGQAVPRGGRGLLYERRPDFAALVERTDPRGAFANEWLRTRVLAGA